MACLFCLCGRFWQEGSSQRRSYSPECRHRADQDQTRLAASATKDEPVAHSDRGEQGQGRTLQPSIGECERWRSVEDSGCQRSKGARGRGAHGGCLRSERPVVGARGQRCQWWVLEIKGPVVGTRGRAGMGCRENNQGPGMERRH